MWAEAVDDSGRILGFLDALAEERKGLEIVAEDGARLGPRVIDDLVATAQDIVLDLLQDRLEFPAIRILKGN